MKDYSRLQELALNNEFCGVYSVSRLREVGTAVPIGVNLKQKLALASFLGLTLTPNPSPKIGRGEQILQFPFSQVGRRG
ncbi:hypothetical protein KBT16_23895 [Nostoc sp. CCCryo 231-06]|nr:hypothetical protein [Nostoc sp. CCCryo 231-06]